MLCAAAAQRRTEAGWQAVSCAWRAQDHTSEVIGDIMDSIRRHQVALKGVVSTVVVTTLVLEGARRPRLPTLG